VVVVLVWREGWFVWCRFGGAVGYSYVPCP